MKCQENKTVEFFSSNTRLVFPPGGSGLRTDSKVIRTLKANEPATINFGVKVTQ
jgi:hypothetical protein